MGSVVISVDAELGWGFHDLENPPIDRVEAGREGWNHLLNLFDEYDVPATWGVVGHLFLDECDSVHANHPTPADWFIREREDSASRRTLLFGDQLIDRLLNADADHDVGCHMHTHVVLDKEWITPEIVRAELEAAIEAGKQLGIEYDSFIFPRNIVGYRKFLAEYGFTTYRSQPPSGLGWSISKLVALADANRVRLVEPSVDEFGLIKIPPSLFLFGIKGPISSAFESVWTDPIVRLSKIGIDRAIREDSLFHIWLHPNNLSTSRDVKRMRAILEYINRRRSDSGLAVETMADVANRVKESKKLKMESLNPD